MVWFTLRLKINYVILSSKKSKLKGLSGLTFNLRSAPNGKGEERGESVLFPFMGAFLAYPYPFPVYACHASQQTLICLLYFYMFA